MPLITPRHPDATLPRPAATPDAGRSPQRAPAILSRAWRDRRLALLTGLGLPALLGLAVGLLSPRGPATALATLGLMALAVIVGTVAGLVLASRWGWLAATLAHAVVLELVRLPVEGPTVDAISVAGLPQIAALLVGRGWYGLVVMLPMALAAVGGRALVQWHCHQRAVLDVDAELRVLDRLGIEAEVLDAGCCGMAGSFGFERGEHHEVSQRCGERVLLPAVRAAGDDAVVLADGFSCREQIAQGTGRHALHLADLIALGIDQARPREEPP